MLTLYSSTAARPQRRVVLRATRPALIDLRFKGDPWVVDHLDGTASVCLGDYPLLRVGVCAFDLPSLNRTLQQIRTGQARRLVTSRSQAAKN